MCIPWWWAWPLRPALARDASFVLLFLAVRGLIVLLSCGDGGGVGLLRGCCDDLETHFLYYYLILTVVLSCMFVPAKNIGVNIIYTCNLVCMYVWKEPRSRLLVVGCRTESSIGSSGV